MEKYEKKAPFWKKAGNAALEILGELVITAVLFAIGAGILILLGNKKAVADMDPDMTALLGALVVLAVFGMVFAVASAVRKKKKKE